MCDAGLEGRNAAEQSHPYEDTSVNASWTTTLGLTLPWDSEPVLLSNLPMDQDSKPAFFMTDIWHNFHLGLSKHFIGSSIVCAIERLDCFPVAAVDARFQWFTNDFAQFCQQNNIHPYLKEISRETMTFPQAKSCPVGRWSKGVVASQIMRYLENFCDRFVTNKTDDEVMLTVVFGNITSEKCLIYIDLLFSLLLFSSLGKCKLTSLCLIVLGDQMRQKQPKRSTWP